MRYLRTPSALRNTAVLALAALCLHQLVYLVSFGAGSGPALEGAGHGYLSFAAPLLAVIAICAVAGNLLAAARRSGVPLPGRGGAGWLLWTALLLAIFAAQEATEVLLRTGSLGQLVALVHQAGAAALVAAIALGRLVTVALSGLDALEATLARSAGSRPRAPAALDPATSHSPLHLPRLSLAFGFARRPPPATAA